MILLQKNNIKDIVTKLKAVGKYSLFLEFRIS